MGLKEKRGLGATTGGHPILNSESHCHYVSKGSVTLKEEKKPLSGLKKWVRKLNEEKEKNLIDLDHGDQDWLKNK